MEENQELFSLSVDPTTRSNLAETAKWVRFLAIVGVIYLVCVFAVAVYQYTLVNRYTSLYERYGSVYNSARATTIFTYVILVVLLIFPVIYMFRFSSKLKIALEGNDQVAFDEAFQYLKMYFRYLGVITIILLALFALVFFIAFIGRAV